ncbi:MAG: PAS domain-containing sensor histidine kinase [Bacteroidota bacterium]
MNSKFFEMPVRLFVLSIFLVVTIFVLEVTMPFHTLITVGYVIIVLYMLQFPQQSNYATALGIFTTILITLGYFLKASEFKNELTVPVNRGLAVLAIWLAVYFSLRFKKLLDAEVRHKEQLNAVFNNATEGILIVNTAGEIILINTFAEQLFGYHERELLGVKVENLVPARLRSSHYSHRQTFMATPKNRPMETGKELIALRKDGSEFPAEISLGHFNNLEGTFAVAFILDLTERKKALENINHEQQLAQTYFELAPVLFVALDKFGTVISINNYGSQLLGYPKEEVIGQNWFKTFQSAETQEEVFDYFNKIIENSFVELRHENTVINNRGEEIEMSWRNILLKDVQGHPLVVLGAGTDITDRKKQEKLAIEHHTSIQNLNDKLEIKIRKRTSELKEAVLKLEAVNKELEKNHQLFTAIMHHFPDSVVGVLNKDLKYIFADGQELQNIGLIKKDNAGERVFNNIHPALSQEAEEKLKAVFNGTKVSYDVEIAEKAYTVSSVPLSDDHNQINEILVVIKNISTQKRIEKDLMNSFQRERELNELKSQFVTMASHEFRTPLTTILSSAFLLENYTGKELDDNKSTHLGKIKKSVNNLIELLNDFISLGKLEEGRIKVVYSKINIREFLEELIPEMELVRKGNQIIRCEYGGEEMHVLSDKQLLRSILLNLISNAIKYSSIESEIKLHAVVSEKELTIDVTDFGIGIPPEEHRHIFKRFYRAENVANIEGTGLGLNIIRKYVRLLKGKIEFQSKLNEGTTFKVTLPLVNEEFEKLS